jgi:hypothetical protein
MISYMDVDSILHIDCKHENLGANDNDIKKKIEYVNFVI